MDSVHLKVMPLAVDGVFRPCVKMELLAVILGGSAKDGLCEQRLEGVSGIIGVEVGLRGVPVHNDCASVLIRVDLGKLIIILIKNFVF